MKFELIKSNLLQNIAREDIKLLKLIEEGENISYNFKTEKKALFVFGTTGTGKSTLINYLNGIPLECKIIFNKWVIDLHDSNKSLPGNFSIGHTHESYTLHPQSYKPADKEYTFIDTAGFYNTRGFLFEISNNLLIKEISNKINEFKFLLLIKYNDINEKGHYFRKSIKWFSNLLGFKTISIKNLANIFKSTALIVTHVENNGFDDNVVLDYFKKKLFLLIHDERKQNNLDEKEFIAFGHLIMNQTEIFSNPKENELLITSQKNRILLKIDSLEFASKDKLKFKINILDEHLRDYYRISLNSFYKLYENFSSSLFINLSNYFENEFKTVNDLDAFFNLYFKLKNTIEKSGFRFEIDYLLNSFNFKVFTQYEKNTLCSLENNLKILIKFLPDEMKISLQLEKNWYSENLILNLKKIEKKLYKNFENKFIEFKEYLDKIEF